MKKNETENQLTVHPPEPSVALMLQGALQNIQSGQITPEHVDVLGKMMDLYERNEARQAKKDFASALADMQAETGTIQAMTPVKNRDGSERYRYAKFEHIMEKAKPMMSKHGFSHSFDTKSDDGTLTAIFKLTHKGGHSESNQFAVRVSKGQGTNDTQDDMGAKSYAKRGAVCDGLGIVISSDDDARLKGKPIGMALAADLRDRVEALGDKIDEQRFLNFAGVACQNPASLDDYMLISDERFDSLDEMLKRKESGASKKVGELL